TLSTICLDMAQIFFASLFVNPILATKIDKPLIVSGFVLALIFWSFGLILTYKFINKSNV
ncbi:MAG: hypothetical protein AAB863_02325, partial [Patescibacteria group bacterium]